MAVVVPGVENGTKNAVEGEYPTSRQIGETWGVPVAEHKKKVGDFIFRRDIARAEKSGYAFVRQFITGSNGPLGESQWNGPLLPLKKFA